MYSILFYILSLVQTTIFFVVYCVIWALTAPFDRKKTILHWFARQWCTCVLQLYPGWKTRIEGTENIDKKKAYVICCNHQSMLDIALLEVIRKNFRWVAKRSVYKYPFFGPALWMHGDITIDRGNAGSTKILMAKAGKYLSQGISIMIFPEGTRSRTGRIGEFKEGAVLIAARHRADILPVVHDGTLTAFKGKKFNKNTFRVKLLEPIAWNEISSAGVKEATRRLHETMTKEHQAMRPDLYKK